MSSEKKLKPTRNKKVRNAVSLNWKGMSFKSKLELFTYQKLIEAGIDNFKYEKDKFTLLEGFTYNEESIEVYDRTIDNNKVKLYDNTTELIRPITYLPDFTCINEDKTGWIIECKGYPNDALNHFKTRSALN